MCRCPGGVLLCRKLDTVQGGGMRATKGLGYCSVGLSKKWLCPFKMMGKVSRRSPHPLVLLLASENLVKEEIEKGNIQNDAG